MTISGSVRPNNKVRSEYVELRKTLSTTVRKVYSDCKSTEDNAVVRDEMNLKQKKRRRLGAFSLYNVERASRALHPIQVRNM